MKIQDNFYYISQSEQNLIERGLASLDVHSIHLEGKGTRDVNGKIKEIVDMLNEKFLIYQYAKNENGKYVCGYNDNWDLFFWSNGNLEYPFTDTRFNFNTNKRNYEERQKDLKSLKEILENYTEDSVTVTIQYTTSFHEEEIAQLADSVYEKLKNTFINFMGHEGKIKIVPDYNDSYYGSRCKYGFFKKGSKRKYYQLTNMDILEMS